MFGNMHRNQSVNVHQFAMIPKAEIPRSRFNKDHAHKTTFSAANLVPIYLDEVLPGDTMEMHATMYARMSTPIYPIMDNLYLESFFFFVPMRLVWIHWDKFFGAQENPGDSTSFTIPVCNASAGGYAAFTLGDYFGLGTAGQITGAYSHSALPFRCYNLIWNLWFRDENLQNSATYGSATGTSQWGSMDDGPDPIAQYTLLKRGKRHDYFTSCLPWTQKGGVVQLPLAGTATVKTSTTRAFTGAQTPVTFFDAAAGGNPGGANLAINSGTNNQLQVGTNVPGAFTGAGIYPNNLIADLSTAGATTINTMRLAFATQKVLERDARGGTRYQEKIFAHFGVMGSDARLMRPEYLGGGKQAIQLQPVPQTGPTGTTGSTSPLGTLSAFGQVLASGHGFKQSFTEHGYIIGLVSVNADLTYQQGLRRLWTRSTQYDFYLPAFAHLGEQAVRNDEIYVIGGAGGQDQTAFGFNERWAEYRYMPSMITGAFRSTYATPLDAWHLAEKFAALPALNSTFIQSTTDATVRRAIQAGAAADGEQFIFDGLFECTCTRAMPLYSVPGFIDRF